MRENGRCRNRYFLLLSLVLAKTIVHLTNESATGIALGMNLVVGIFCVRMLNVCHNLTVLDELVATGSSCRLAQVGDLQTFPG